MAFAYVAVGGDLVLVGDDNVIVEAVSPEVQAIVDYYTNLLIIQYHEKPKAKATIALYVQTILANGLFLDVDRAFNLDTALGVQLDILGKYIGVDRFFTLTDPVNFFAQAEYDEVDPDSDQKYGFSTYATFNDEAFNGTLTYSSVVTVDNQLNDEDYRKLLRLKIFQNNSDHSHKSIDEAMFEFFGNSVIPESAGGMTMFYKIDVAITDLILAAVSKGVLPRPMGVGLGLITDVTGPLFGFSTYESIPSNDAGFQTYGTYGSVNGEILTYDQIVNP